MDFCNTKNPELRKVWVATFSIVPKWPSGVHKCTVAFRDLQTLKWRVETQWRTCASKIKAQHYFTSNTLWRKAISSPPWKPSHSHNRQKPDKSTQPSDLDSLWIIHFLLCPDILGWSTNSQPFSLFGSDLDQVQNSGPYWSDCRVWKYLFWRFWYNFCCWKILVWPPSISAAFPRIRVRESRWNRGLVATLL